MPAAYRGSFDADVKMHQINHRTAIFLTLFGDFGGCVIFFFSS